MSQQIGERLTFQGAEPEFEVPKGSVLEYADGPLFGLAYADGYSAATQDEGEWFTTHDRGLKVAERIRCVWWLSHPADDAEYIGIVHPETRDGDGRVTAAEPYVVGADSSTELREWMAGHAVKQEGGLRPLSTIVPVFQLPDLRLDLPETFGQQVAANQ
jgi:hypothetical protein